MSHEVTVADLASALISSFEGCRLVSYLDAGGIPTVGFGHTRGVKLGLKITQEQANQFLVEDAAPLIEMVKDRPVIEAAALVSFGYNCGQGALRRVLIAEPLPEGDAMKVRLEDFNHAGGEVLVGLQRRRAVESMLIAASRQAVKP